MSIFQNSVEKKNQDLLKSNKNDAYFTCETNIHFLSYLAQFFLEWEMLPTKVVEKIKTHVLCLVTLKKKSRQLWDNVEKYCRAGGATADNTPYAHCMLDTSGYKNTLRICNTYWLSTATIIARTRLTVTLYVHCLSVCLVTFLLI